MTSKTMDLPDIPADRAVKLNVEGAGNYRVQYDEASWKLLLARVAEAELGRSGQSPAATPGRSCRRIARRSRSISSWSKNCRPKPSWPSASRSCTCSISSTGSWPGQPQREQFQKYARSILRPSFEQVGWEPKNGEPRKIALLRGEPDQRAGRSRRRRDRGRLPRALPKISRRSEIARAGFASAASLPSSGVTRMKRPGRSCTSSA